MSVQAMPTQDAGGKLFYVARVADHTLANRYSGNLFEDAETVAAALDADETPSATVSKYHYEDVTRGLVDYHETEEN